MKYSLALIIGISSLSFGSATKFQKLAARYESSGPLKLEDFSTTTVNHGYCVNARRPDQVLPNQVLVFLINGSDSLSPRYFAVIGRTDNSPIGNADVVGFFKQQIASGTMGLHPTYYSSVERALISWFEVKQVWSAIRRAPGGIILKDVCANAIECRKDLPWGTEYYRPNEVMVYCRF